VAAAARNDPSALDDRRRAALSLADAFVTDPARIAGARRAEILEHLAPAEVVEVLFDVIAWSKQKVLVALEIDRAVDADVLTPLGFDAEGHALIGDVPRWW